MGQYALVTALPHRSWRIHVNSLSTQNVQNIGYLDQAEISWPNHEKRCLEQSRSVRPYYLHLLTFGLQKVANY